MGLPNTYKLKIITALLLPLELNEFCRIAEEMPNGIVTVSQDNSVISGKSLVNLMTLDFNRPVDIILQGEFDDEYIEKFDRYRKGDD